MDLGRHPLEDADTSADGNHETPSDTPLDDMSEPGCNNNGVCDREQGETCAICFSDCGYCECTTDDDCPLVEEKCVEGMCIIPCSTELQCPPGEVCDVGECASVLTTWCVNGIDDDRDSFIDCRDPNCTSNGCFAKCGQEDTEALCHDGADTDGNGKADCTDDNCLFSPHVTSCSCSEAVGRECGQAACVNLADDDGDGDTDCEDEDCLRDTEVTACGSENTDTLCSDEEDNDGNGFADCDDLRCLQSVWVTVCCTMRGG
jgi:hypothetical protein